MHCPCSPSLLPHHGQEQQKEGLLPSTQQLHLSAVLAQTQLWHQGALGAPSAHTAPSSSQPSQQKQRGLVLEAACIRANAIVLIGF